MQDVEIKNPPKESYEEKEIIGESNSPEAQEAVASIEAQSENTQPPPNPNIRFKAIVMFDSKINEIIDDLIMPPQYAGNRAMFVRKGKICARNFDKVTGIDTTQYELKKTDEGYIKPEAADGKE